MFGSVSVATTIPDTIKRIASKRCIFFDISFLIGKGYAERSHIDAKALDLLILFHGDAPTAD